MTIATVNDTDDLCRVGPGTVMGDMMRQYWIPAAMSSEVEADGAPVRLMLLGEKLIAFRDSSGRVGIMDHRCPHRCASLFLGRNEEDGLRCIYHGWKFDVDGNCVDMPSVPVHQDFKDKVHAKAYRARERNGLIWVYMGERADPPPLPLIEANLLPVDEQRIVFIQRSCNWLQALEGDIDTSHFGFLHAGGVDPDDLRTEDLMRYTVVDRAPEYHIADTDWGATYCAHRSTSDGRTYWRFSNYMVPFWTQPPQGDIADHISARAWVPMDDTHTMTITISWTKMKPGIPALKTGKPIPGTKTAVPMMPNTTDWFGRWRPMASEVNDWTLDRSLQKAGVYSGIEVVHLQDLAVTESMGACTDRDFEHLGPGDQMIARTRRRLLQEARAFRDHRAVPARIDNPAIYYGPRAGEFLVPSNADWEAVYEEQLKSVLRPAVIHP